MMDLLSFVIACFYFYLPAALANSGATIGKFVPFFKDIKFPIDFGLSFRGKRLIGDHKVFGSFLFGIIFGSLIGLIKYLLLDKYMKPYLLLDLSLGENMALYILMSTSALLGDTLKSVLKRLFGIAPHKAWVPFDEIDHSSVSLLVASIFYPISLKIILLTVTIYFFLHILSNLVAFGLKIKKVPF